MVLRDLDVNLRHGQSSQVLLSRVFESREIFAGSGSMRRYNNSALKRRLVWRSTRRGLTL